MTIFCDKRRIILDNRLHEYITSTLDYTDIQKKWSKLYQVVNNSRSQSQTCTTLCSMDNHTIKKSANGLKIDAQQTTTNIYQLWLWDTDHYIYTPIRPIENIVFDTLDVLSYSKIYINIFYFVITSSIIIDTFIIVCLFIICIKNLNKALFSFNFFFAK